MKHYLSSCACTSRKALARCQKLTRCLCYANGGGNTRRLLEPETPLKAEAPSERPTPLPTERPTLSERPIRHPWGFGRGQHLDPLLGVRPVTRFEPGRRLRLSLAAATPDCAGPSEPLARRGCPSRHPRRFPFSAGRRSYRPFSDEVPSPLASQRRPGHRRWVQARHNEQLPARPPHSTLTGPLSGSCLAALETAEHHETAQPCPRPRARPSPGTHARVASSAAPPQSASTSSLS